MGWYYARHGQQTGPVADTEFAQLVASGTVTAATLVWQPGMPEWKTYGEVHGANPAIAGDADSAICAVSGKIRPKREMIQYEGQWVSAEHRDEFFQRLREGVVVNPLTIVPGPYGYAGFWWRFLAVFIDGIALYVVNQVFNMIIAVVMFGSALRAFNQQLDPNNMAPFFAYLGMTILVNTTVGLIYSWFFVSRYDATPGKMAVGLKILRSDGSRLTNGRIIGRYFAHWISAMPVYIGYMMAGWDEEKRALHDRICDTRVIRTRR